MSIEPSPRYKNEGKQKGISEDILQNAISQALPLVNKGLAPVLTLNHLAYMTGTQYQYLREIISRSRDPYKVFQISKRSGGKRIICVAEPPLKIVQGWLNREVLTKVSPHWRSFAFVPGSSIVKCAQEHCGCRWLIKLDIRRFFESISEIEVYKVFLSMGYQPLVAFEMARICTRQHPRTGQVRDRPEWLANPQKYKEISAYRTRALGHLPQGASTSPMLANLACREIDEEIFEVALNFGLTYTRYADDMIFSTSENDFSGSQAGKFIKKIYRIMKRNSLEPHTAKAIVVPPGARKVVLGLLVDKEKPALTKDFRQRLERHVWAIKKHGFANHARHLGFKSLWGFQRHIEGYIAFAKMVQPEFAIRIEQEFRDALANEYG